MNLRGKKSGCVSFHVEFKSLTSLDNSQAKSSSKAQREASELGSMENRRSGVARWPREV
jgi:hypothetical protein